MPEAPYQLDLRRAQIVLIAIRETCRYRDWDLIAAHIRTTHTHLIVDRLENPDRTISQLNSYASRMLTKPERIGATRP
jgi:REP element-mobilizing transposase RayT